MTLRERIADWISGGALTRAKSRSDRSEALVRKWIDHSYELSVRRKYAEDDAEDQSSANEKLRHALNRIAACETPNANATVRRMARIAREAME